MDVDDLYGLPLDQFVPERTALARELRSAGKREEAAAVAALRKPSVAAWAVNQLVRTQRTDVAELFEAGDALRSAQDDVVAGRGDGRSLRAAVERERAAVDGLTGAARGLLTSEGHELSQTIIDRVADTLHAAALDDDARSQVKDGRLERELRHVGLGDDGGGSVAGAGTRPAEEADGRIAAAARAGRTRAGRGQSGRPRHRAGGAPASRNGRSGRPTRQRSAGIAPPRRSRRRRPSCRTPRRSSRRRATSSAPPSRRVRELGR